VELGRRFAEALARSQSLLLTPAELSIGETGGIALALLGRNPGEDPVEIRVLDDRTRRERRVILRGEASCQR